MPVLLWLIFVAVSIINFVKADQVAANARRQWEGKRMPRPLAWVMGSPPSGAHIRKVNVVPAVLSGAMLLLNLANM